MKRGIAITVAVIAVLLSPITTWWLVGDVSETDIVDPDYLVRPPQLSSSEELALGAGATALLVAAAFVVALAARKRVVTWLDLRLLVPSACLGVYLGFTLRVVTAGVIGANIGGGLLVLLTPVMAVAMVAWTGVWWLTGRKRKTPRRRDRLGRTL